MKNLLICFLALTCVTANAQYNQTLSESSPLLKPAKTSAIVSSYDSPGLKIPYHLLASTTSNRVSLTNFSPAPGAQMAAPSNNWTGSMMTTKSANGVLQTTHYFDQMGNLQNTNTSFTFKKRKK